MSQGRVLIVAGSDSGGGAGVQGDVKTVTVLGGYAATAITAITVQNTLGVSDIHPLPPALVAAQMMAVLGDIGADAVKLGMLGGAETIAAIADVLGSLTMPIVLDPVMVAKGGARLLSLDAEAVLRRLIPMATLVTPNAPELAVLSGMSVTDAPSALAAGRALLDATGTSVLVKGGHLDEPSGSVWLLTRNGGQIRFAASWSPSRHTHGTGCALASGIATGLAQGLALAPSIERAHRFVHHAIQYAPGLGRGHGPLGFLDGARALSTSV